MNAGWQTKPLGEVCTLQRGFDLPTHDRKKGRFPLVSSSGISDSHDEGPVLSPGVVTGRSGSIGSVFYIEDAFWPLNTTLYVRDFHGNLPRFVYYLLVAFDLKKYAGGTGVPTLNRNDVHGVPVIVPGELPEQQRIVTLLDEAFDGIATAKAHAEKNLQNARAIFESQREVLLSFKQDWLEAPLAALCEVKHGYAFEGEFFASDGDYVLLTPGSFYETGGYRERGEKTKFFRGQIPGDYILDVGDLLVAMTEQAAGLLGSPLLVPESDRFLHNQRLGLVTGKPGIPWDNEFFFHVFNLGRVRQEIHASSSGVKVRHTSPGRIGAVQVAYPKSVAEQTSVAAQLGDLSTECERLESLYRQKLTVLDELKKSLLHRAFNGDL